MDIIQKKILILSRLQTDIWEATRNVRKPMKLEIRQTFEMFFSKPKESKSIAEMNNYEEIFDFFFLWKR